MLVEQTNKIKELSLAIKSNFLEIGRLLIEIRDNEIYKEKYNSFTGYLESEEFEFSRRHAYNFIELYKEYHTVKCVAQIPFRTLLQLVHVSDSQIRKQLTEEAIDIYQKKENIQEFYNKVRRSSTRCTETVTEEDSQLLKCRRQLSQLLDDIIYFNKTKEELRVRLNKCLCFASKFKEYQEINSLVLEIRKIEI